MDINNKTIWITGASSGIGLELCRQLASKGARIILSARRRELLLEVAASLPGGLDRHWVVPLDLANSDNLGGIVQSSLADIGPVHILINNGGISQRSLFIDTDLSVYRQLMEVNYLGTVAMTKALLPGMVAQGQGMVVSVSSVAGKIGSKLRTGYSGSKFAVVGFMDCLRAETAEHGIQCLTVCPGSIQTNIAINALNEHGAAQNKNDDSILNGMSVEKCVQGIVKAMLNNNDEVVVGKGLSAIAPTIKRFFPALFNKISAKMEYR
ncbi:3-oxoacyl-[acyl-carrier-protein] reductase FabG [Zhongshania aliphaticivorans]|uniref:3-oxoacyl-[acyl-carrier-protein] reductase FabG n=1 Tax=Zhongshania aliphaticivorans TaxID=1470434 RepID=A0A5S9NPW2_9GAMM|nr:SDR family oxidoreductase [Zhongshania aliphaticivorans]CAA0092452.1 3-oxoacyl-[acyl-carrier-protein] reductase FabG [Zhongshania aliphaticivorans]CAA0109734.1 3-oxoacyl-[acyl-carrier-protein] reductase FabG [Zhongshania aliphaticivorans]